MGRIERLKKIVNEIDSTIQVVELTTENLVSFKNMYNDWSTNASAEINKTVNHCTTHTKTYLNFTCVVPPDKTYSIHWHDVVEIITIIEGTLKEELSNKIYHKNDTFIIPPYMKHVLTNPSKDKTLIFNSKFLRKEFCNL